MATARDESEDVVEALRLGANDYVTKPFDYPVVLARVQTQLSLKRSVDRIRALEQNLERQNAELELANRRMKRDLAAAARVQEALLPAGMPNLPGARFAWQFRPCTELAGDLLNVVPLGEGQVSLFVLDVVGHGVAAALLAVMAHRVLARLGQGPAGPPGPAEVARQLQCEFPFEERTSQFFTLHYGVLDLGGGAFRFISAGHPGPVYVPADAPAQNLNVPGFPIGLGDGAYHEQVLSLRPGDRLYLYSDGLTDAQNPAQQRFGEARVVSALERARARSLGDSVTSLLTEVEAWCGPASPHDDISILAAEIAPGAASFPAGSAPL
jgi:sigma-B regulation protein RsbU (phosphoserine phosphatase)